MAEEFKAISTQEELNEVIKERLDRQKRQFETQIEELNSKLASQNKDLETLRANSEEVEKMKISLERKELKRKIAIENDLPYEFAERLQGEDEESIRKDAEEMAKFIAKNTYVPPLKDLEPKDEDKMTKAYKSLI